jgi:hypothetical protein
VNDSITVIVHEQQVLRPVQGISLSVLKCIAAQQAHAILQSDDEFSLSRLCDCKSRKAENPVVIGETLEPIIPSIQSKVPVEEAVEEPDQQVNADSLDETCEGFNDRGRLLREMFEGQVVEIADEGSDEEAEIMEVDESLSQVPESPASAVGLLIGV